ncbi:MAG: Maf family nucleotide pyrophosphatase [Gammaproteobacteria bacterium]|nr:Maf family nucleotide pyrophosphatase [Gammaproteobacteria bacterium]
MLDCILASSSPYRRSLLERLRIPFRVVVSGLDESAYTLDTPMKTAQILAIAKAQLVAGKNKHSLVIGCDQTLECDGNTLGKPKSFEVAMHQLSYLSGKTVHFYSALALVCRVKGLVLQEVATVRAKYKSLSKHEIEKYLMMEQPYDCAGSAKSEGLGITLFDFIESDDPTALLGLPLIRLYKLLTACGHVGPSMVFS